MARAKDLAVGQRVRVRNRPSCEYCTEAGSGFTGAVGVVSDARHDHGLSNEPEFMRHHFWVKFDTDAGETESHFAAAELDIVP